MMQRQARQQSVSLAKHEGRGAMSVGPLERQLRVAVVTHSSACLF